jgi:hypothetical protein
MVPRFGNSGGMNEYRHLHRGFSVYSETSIPFRTADGRRVLVLTHEVPCGLICRTTWYYVEE